MDEALECNYLLICCSWFREKPDGAKVVCGFVRFLTKPATPRKCGSLILTDVFNIVPVFIELKVWAVVGVVALNAFRFSKF